MLETHQRAARISNAPHIPWHHFLSSRFLGRLPARDGGTAVAMVMQAIAQRSEYHAEVHGCMEYGDAMSPVVFEFTGTLELASREIALQEPHPKPPERNYAGNISENGRVIMLHVVAPDGRASKPFYLIQEETLAQLT